MSKKEIETLRIRIDSPESLIWEGQASSISSINSEGPFDILPQHASFITFIEDQPLIIRDQRKEIGRYLFERAIIYVNQNSVTVYTHI